MIRIFCTWTVNLILIRSVRGHVCVGPGMHVCHTNTNEQLEWEWEKVEWTARRTTSCHHGTPISTEAIAVLMAAATGMQQTALWNAEKNHISAKWKGRETPHEWIGMPMAPVFFKIMFNRVGGIWLALLLTHSPFIRRFAFFCKRIKKSACSFCFNRSRFRSSCFAWIIGTTLSRFKLIWNDKGLVLHLESSESRER